MVESLIYLIPPSRIGDWFVLYQMSKNLNKRFFYTFLLRLSKDSDAVRNRWKLVDKVNRSSPFKLVH